MLRTFSSERDIMFGSKKKEEPVQEVAIVEEKQPEVFVQADKTIIGEGITMVGDFSGKDPIIVQGTVKGNLNSENNVHIAATGKLIGDGIVKDIEVDGFIEGNVECSQAASFSKTGKMKGKLSTVRLKTDDGSVFEGTLELKQEIYTTPEEPAEEPTEA